MREYRDQPEEFIAPTEAELRARNARSAALAVGLLVFVVAVFAFMLARNGII